MAGSNFYPSGPGNDYSSFYGNSPGSAPGTPVNTVGQTNPVSTIPIGVNQGGAYGDPGTMSPAMGSGVGYMDTYAAANQQQAALSPPPLTAPSSLTASNPWSGLQPGGDLSQTPGFLTSSPSAMAYAPTGGAAPQSQQQKLAALLSQQTPLNLADSHGGNMYDVQPAQGGEFQTAIGDTSRGGSSFGSGDVRGRIVRGANGETTRTPMPETSIGWGTSGAPGGQPPGGPNTQFPLNTQMGLNPGQMPLNRQTLPYGLAGLRG